MGSDNIFKSGNRLIANFDDRGADAILTYPPLGARQDLPDDATNFLAATAMRIDDLPMGTDIRVVDHLLHTYWCWHHSVFPIMSRKAFSDSIRYGGRYYTPLLLNVGTLSFKFFFFQKLPSLNGFTMILKAMLSLTCHLSSWEM
jgi:hypothetical protein